MMEVQNLSYRYKGSPELLRNVSFSLETGKLLAVLGNNGAGKSTLLKCFNHILTPDSGRVLLDGEDLLTQSPREVAKQVAFVSQSIPGTRMTVHDAVMLGRRPYMKWGFTEKDHEIVHRAMDRLGVEALRGSFLAPLQGFQGRLLFHALQRRRQNIAAANVKNGVFLNQEFECFQQIHIAPPVNACTESPNPSGAKATMPLLCFVPIRAS